MDYLIPSRYSVSYKRTWKRSNSHPIDTIKTTVRTPERHPNKHSVLYFPESYTTSTSASNTNPALFNPRYQPYPNHTVAIQPVQPPTVQKYLAMQNQAVEALPPPTSLNFPQFSRGPLLLQSQSALDIKPSKNYIEHVRIEDLIPYQEYDAVIDDPDPPLPLLLSQIFFLLHNLLPPAPNTTIRLDYIPPLINQISALLSPNSEPTAAQLYEALENLYFLHTLVFPVLVHTPSVNREVDRLVRLVGKLRRALKEKSYWSWECYYCLDFASSGKDGGVEGLRKAMVGVCDAWEVGVLKGRMPGGWAWP